VKIRYIELAENLTIEKEAKQTQLIYIH